MPDYDASIRINTKVDNSDLRKLPREFDNISESAERAINKIEGNFSSLSDVTEDYATRLKALRDKGFGLGDENYDKLYIAWRNASDAEKEYLANLEKQTDSGISKEAEKNAKLAEQEAEQMKLEELQKNAVVNNQNLVNLLSQQEAITQRMSLLRKAGVGEGYEEYDNLANTLKQINAEIIEQRNGFSKLEQSSKKCFKEIQSGAKKSNGLFATMKSRLKGIALSLLVFNWITKGFNAMVSAMKEGFKNLAQYSSDYNKSMSELRSQTAQLKNGLAAAFEPIANMVIPYLTQLISWMNRAAESVSQFLAAMQGKTTYTRAKKQVIDYAKALDTARNSAKRALASFDELNVLNQKDSGNVNSGGELTGADAFETAEVSSRISEFASEVTEAIKPFKEAIANWWSDIDFEPLLDSFGRLKESCEPFAGYLYEGLLWFLNNILLPLGSWTIEEAVPAFFDLLSAALDFLHIIIEGLKPYGEWLWNELLQPIAEWTGEKVIEGVKFLTEKLRDFSDWCKADKSHVDTMSAVVLGFLAGIMTYYTAKKIVSAVEKISTALKTFGGISKALISPVGLAALAIGTLVTSIILISKNWDKLNGAQKAATVLSGLVAAALAAAVAIAVFHTCWSVGIAAAAIIGGLAALGVSTAILAKQNVSSNDGAAGTAFYNANDFSGSPLPMLADGAVIQGGRPFAAILGDQRYGQTNIEAPLATIQEALQNVMDQNGGNGEINITVNLDGEVVYKDVVRRDMVYRKQTGNSAFIY